MRLCSEPGCGRATPNRYCAECQTEKQARAGAPQPDDTKTHSSGDRQKYAFLYADSRWTRVSKMVRARHPLCARCELSITVLVDHIVPAGIAIQQARDSGRYLDPWAGFYLLSNLQGLCAACHHLKTVEDKTHTGPWPDVLAAEDQATKKRWTF